MTGKKELKGLVVACVTPFTEDGETLDEAGLRGQIDSLLEAGMHNILVCGGTGEFAYLRKEERLRIAEIAGRHIDGRAGFMVQTSAVNTVDTIEFSKHAEDTGADGLLVLPPYFEGPDLAGVFDHYENISKEIDVPIMVYNIPSHTGIDITPEFFQDLLEIDNIKYIKDTSGDLRRVLDLIQLVGGEKIFMGGDPFVFYALQAGCAGSVWGGCNAMPKEAVEMYELTMAGRLVEANDLWNRILPSNLFFWNHVYNAAVKAATNLSGRKVGPCRKPVRPLTDLEMANLQEALKPLGI
jgi:4-hydroxy-tetrahydrodipicolinate synthase